MAFLRFIHAQGKNAPPALLKELMAGFTGVVRLCNFHAVLGLFHDTLTPERLCPKLPSPKRKFFGTWPSDII
jgi:hypothetical protein